MYCIISAVHIPLRTKPDTDLIRTQSNDSNEQSDNPDTMSDDFDSDSKENENVSLFVIIIFEHTIIRIWIVKTTLSSI